MYYYLEDDKTISPCSLDKWAYQNRNISHIGNDDVNGKWVSTVWLGIDHDHFHQEPLLFETMVFPSRASGRDLYCERYSSWQDAVDGHQRAIQWVKDNYEHAQQN